MRREDIRNANPVLCVHNSAIPAHSHTCTTEHAHQRQTPTGTHAYMCTHTQSHRPEMESQELGGPESTVSLSRRVSLEHAVLSTSHYVRKANSCYGVLINVMENTQDRAQYIVTHFTGLTKSNRRDVCFSSCSQVPTTQSKTDPLSDIRGVGLFGCSIFLF